MAVRQSLTPDVLGGGTCASLFVTVIATECKYCEDYFAACRLQDSVTATDVKLWIRSRTTIKQSN